MIYADYSFYVGSFYGNSIKEVDFPRLALKASQFLDYYTRGKATDYADKDAVKMACCAIAEQVALNEAGNTAYSGVKSESVGSYSVSYETAVEKISTAKAARAAYAATAMEYLAGTGLLYRGGGCC